jgi:hypothetical protein
LVKASLVPIVVISVMPAPEKPTEKRNDNDFGLSVYCRQHKAILAK